MQVLLVEQWHMRFWRLHESAIHGLMITLMTTMKKNRQIEELRALSDATYDQGLIQRPKTWKIVIWGVAK